MLRGTSPAAAGVLVTPIRRIGGLGPRAGLFGGSLVYSENWAGYDATGGGFTSVTASWTQPAVQADSSSESDAAFWVGLDGDGSNSVEQIGTEGYSQGGSVGYDAWYEMYPADMRIIGNVTVSPGDLITASVTSDGSGDFSLTLTDATTGQSFTTDEYSASAQGYSAEVIAEAPSDSSSGNLIPLADFGTVDFTGCAFNAQPISAFDWNRIDMATDDGGTIASASALGGDGASFSVSSGATPQATLSPPSDVTPPTLSGSPAVSDTLSCSTGSWSGDPPPTFAFQWTRDGSPIGGATASSYTVQAAMRAMRSRAWSRPATSPGRPLRPATVSRCRLPGRRRCSA